MRTHAVAIPREWQEDLAVEHTVVSGTHLQLGHQHRSVQAFLILSFVSGREHLALRHGTVWKVAAMGGGCADVGDRCCVALIAGDVRRCQLVDVGCCSAAVDVVMPPELTDACYVLIDVMLL